MLIEAIRLRHVRGFGEEGVALRGLGEGLNVLSARNEFGKSTIFDALKAALFLKYTSRHRDVASLQPDPGGGAPEVDIDFSADGRSLTLKKRFLSRPMAEISDRPAGRVLYEADDAERFLKELMGADKPSEGPAGLLWVAQGESLQQPDAREGRAEAIQSALDAELDDVAGGERSRAVLEKAKAALDAMVTAERQQPKAGSDYKRAADDVAALAEAEGLLEAKVHASLKTRDALSAAQDELARLMAPGEAGKLETALEEAQEALRAGRTEAAALAALESEAARLSRDEEAACAALERRLAAEAEAESAAAALAAAAAAESAARQTLESAKETETAAGEAVADAEAAAKKAEAHLAAARRAEEARRAAETRAVLAGRIARAREIIAALQELGPPRAAPDIPALEKAAEAAIRTEAAAEAQRTSLLVEAADGSARLDGKALSPGDRVALADGARLTVGEAVRLTVAAPHGQSEKAAEEAKARLAGLLGEAGVESLAEARGLAEAVAEEARRRRALTEEKETLAPEGLEPLGAEMARLDALLGAEPGAAGDLPSLAEAEAAQSEAAFAAGEARRRLDAAREGTTAADTGSNEALIERRVAETRLQEKMLALGPEAEWPERRASLEKAQAEKAEAAAAARAALDEAKARLPGLGRLEAEVQRLGEAVKNRKERIDARRHDVAILEERLRHEQAQGAEELLAETREQRAAAEEALARYRRQADALKLLVDALSAARGERRALLQAPVTAELRPLLAALFPDSGLTLGDDLSPAALARPHGEEPVTRLSGGTREQIAVLTRLAFARLMAARGRAVPVVLDDALVFADDDRIARMFTAMTMAASGIQIIVFTCRSRVFDELGGRRVEARPLVQEPAPSSAAGPDAPDAKEESLAAIRR